ncbi:hypothetical protein B9G98_02640 [Wickerhamiella sorbophila]|uniref:NADH-ubiquinone oxidoreductase 9.5 kDa subunit n=1 Tax=Wickerhamiella sorbophila TaxID=45607 RepID=A0A2T0FJ59_9ASCO|nr:hypothetical protein B9G98_02640 [Wickerhamiella sorbophila]PRT55020.1 hypothetical protein B9G98_02640 [Wickerhamiella sorbophila]
MSSPRFWSQPVKYLRYASYDRPHVVLAFILGVGGPLAAVTLYNTREKYLYKDAPLIPLSYPLPAKRDTTLTGYDD